jgi:ABC-type transport system involved in cytochrome bd biosynthesis fused ATPase/permease subunit
LFWVESTRSLEQGPIIGGIEGGGLMNIDKRLFTYIRYMRLYMIVLGGLSVLAAALIVLQAHFITTVIDGTFLGKQTLAQEFGQGFIPFLSLGLLLAIIGIRASLFWVNEILAHKMATQAKNTLRNRLFQHLFKLGPIFTKGERSGELVNTATEGVETLDAYFSQVLPQICATAIIPVIILIVVFANDLLSGIVLLVTLPILPIFMILIGKQAEAATKKRWYQLGQMSAHFLDVLQGATTLKLFGRNRQQKETIRQMSDRFGTTTLQVLRIAFLSALVMELGATISTAIVAVEIGLRLLYGQMPFANAFFILLLTPEYYQPLRALGPQFHASMASAAGAKRIFDILNTPAGTNLDTPAGINLDTPAGTILNTPAETILNTTSARKGRDGTRPPSTHLGVERCVDDGFIPSRPLRALTPTHASHSTHANQPTIKQSLTFEGVRYTYTNSEGESHPALRGISFAMKMGQRVALVGPSGSGKTTIANLLLRFIEPQQGTIRADGIPIQTFNAQDWRKLVAWQPQNPYLFNTTVAENIRMGKADASMDEVIAAAQKANIHEVIQTLPQGYNTPIGERGTRFSGGQVQRLSLARAFLKDAPLLILDEATSTLDTEAEAHVLAALSSLMQGRMVLIIAHRLNTIRSADQILVLKEGNIIDSGTHTTLMQTSKAYQQLVQAYDDGKAVA